MKPCGVPDDNAASVAASKRSFMSTRSFRPFAFSPGPLAGGVRDKFVH